ncbi:MAG TPA: DUF58 domain-containing protein [Longimicrobium sp.]|nr:DUF58 domain-containing protein [Longimicrobium sp.]
MNVIPTGRLLGLMSAASLLFLVDWRYGVWVDLALLGLMAADALLVPRPDQLSVERKVPKRVSLGATLEDAVTVENRAGRAVRVRLTDDLPPILAREGGDVREVRVGAESSETAAWPLRAERRGDAVLGDVHLRVLGPLGLAWRQRRVAREDTLRVVPGVREVRQYRLLGLRNRLREAGFRAARQRGEGGSFESLREYVRGDDPRTIDWKATARRGSYIVRQYEVERRQNVLLAIDAGRLMTQAVGSRERIDYALTAALLLADVAAMHGDNVGLLVFADRVEQYIPPSRASLARLSEALSEVHARVVEPNYPAAFTYLATQLRRRSLLVIFTDVIDSAASSALVAHLGRSAMRHLPIVVALRNPELEAAAASKADDETAVFRRAAAEELLQARSAALAAMQRTGVLVADARPQDAVPSVVNRYLDVKRRGLL